MTSAFRQLRCLPIYMGCPRQRLQEPSCIGVVGDTFDDAGKSVGPGFLAALIGDEILPNFNQGVSQAVVRRMLIEAVAFELPGVRLIRF